MGEHITLDWAQTQKKKFTEGWSRDRLLQRNTQVLPAHVGMERGKPKLSKLKLAREMSSDKKSGVHVSAWVAKGRLGRM